MSSDAAGVGRGSHDIVTDLTGKELADRIEVWVRSGFYKLDDPMPSSLKAAIGNLVCSHLPLVLDALRAMPDHTPAGRAASSQGEET